MLYRDFGQTGVKVSRLGFGAMRLPISKPSEKAPLSSASGLEESAAIIRHGIDSGITYIDSAPYYCWGESETAVGLAIQGVPRQSLYLATKYPLFNTKDVCRSCLRLRLELSLRKMRTDYIDFYHFWGITWEVYENQIAPPKGILEEVQKARNEGLIRHISFSFHDKPEAAIKLIDTGFFESMLIQYNLLDRANAEPLRHAHAKGLGTVVMGPVGGGRLGTPSEVIAKATGVSSTAEAALRFIFANPDVDVALSGMGSLRQVEENVATASRAEPLAAAEIARIDSLAEQNRKLMDLPCTGCGYCTPCPQGVAIPDIFKQYQWHTAFDLKESAKNEYAGLGKGWNEKKKPVPACTECGQCQEKCPQKIAIVDKLKLAHQILGGK
jgi:uncharacterized protein